MILIPGRLPDQNPGSGKSTWWEELLYIIGVSLFFIGWFGFCFWIWWEFF